ncbi:MAG: tetratricopeptide repeat protein [Bacteroidales bacterium]|nr:tetratricopeptide repeat protein [Bacteroidales bacterium]
MKRFLLFLCLIVTVSVSFSQTQQGYVKTRGRLAANGTAIPGTRLSGATITFKGNRTVTSSTNGVFTFAVPSKTFCITHVQKNGYQLYDNDLLGRDHKFSANDLLVVMDTPDNVLADKLTSERKIRRTLQRQLAEKEDEIEALKEQQKITEEQYRKQLQELYKAQENNEKLISEMAERYSTLDFDQLDDFQRRVAVYIQNGELTRADSLLNTKGSMEERRARIEQNKTIVTINAQELKKRQEEQKKSEALLTKELEDFGKDCFSRYEIYKLQHKNDSAAYFLKMRADLDSTNIRWNIEYANFCRIYLEKNVESERYIQRALQHALLSQKVDEQILCYNMLINVESSRHNYEQALLYVDTEEDLMCRHNLYGIEDQLNVATSRGNIYRQEGKYDLAERYLLKAVSLIENNCDSVSIKILAETLGNYANFCIDVEKYQEALDVYRKILILTETQDSLITPIVITTENNIGNSYYLLGLYDEALIWLEKSLKHAKELYGDKHSSVSISLSNIGAIHMRRKEIDKAIEITDEVISIDKYIYGNMGAKLIVDYINSAKLLCSKNLYDAALKQYNKAIELCRLYYTDSHPYWGTLYMNIASLYVQQKDYFQGIEYFGKALRIFIEQFGEQSVNVARIFHNMGIAYYRMEQKTKAMELLEKAHQIFENKLGTEHPDTKLTQKLLLKVTIEIEQSQNTDTNG